MVRAQAAAARRWRSREQSSARGESESGEGKSELASQIDKDGRNAVEGRRRERPRAAGVWRSPATTLGRAA